MELAKIFHGLYSRKPEATGPLKLCPCFSRTESTFNFLNSEEKKNQNKALRCLAQASEVGWSSDSQVAVTLPPRGGLSLSGDTLGSWLEGSYWHLEGGGQGSC